MSRPERNAPAVRRNPTRQVKSGEAIDGLVDGSGGAEAWYDGKWRPGEIELVE